MEKRNCIVLLSIGFKRVTSAEEDGQGARDVYSQQRVNCRSYTFSEKGKKKKALCFRLKICTYILVNVADNKDDAILDNEYNDCLNCSRYRYTDLL